MDLNIKHDIDLINKYLNNAQKKINELFDLYSNGSINSSDFEYELWQMHFSINELSHGNVHVFIQDKKSRAKLIKVHTKIFKYLNNHEKLISHQKLSNVEI